MTTIHEGSDVVIPHSKKGGTVTSVSDGTARVLTLTGQRSFPVASVKPAREQMISRLARRDADDALDFITSVDSHRLLTEYRFNPYVLTSSSKIRMFPHQIDEVIWGLESPRVLIADEVGLGKTITAALIACEQRARGLGGRSLFVVPKSLVPKWHDELNSRFGFDAQILTSASIRSDSFEKESYAYVASMDFLKQEHIRDRIQNVDLVVIDEAHKMKKGNERLKLGMRLAGADAVILLTATPHDGRDENFLARIRLLDPYAESIPASRYLWRRTVKEDVRNMDGSDVFPPRESETVRVHLTGAERDVARMLESYFDQLYGAASTAQERSALRLLLILLKKRASSSIRALDLSLRRRLNKLGQGTLKDVRQMQRENDDLEDEMDGEPRSEHRGIGYTAMKNLEPERDAIRSILGTINDLGGRDSKFDQLLNSIKARKKRDARAKIVLFTEYVDTLEYLQERLSGYSTGRIDGSMDAMERQEALNSFRSEDGPEIMLCTDAAGEGVDMQFCNVEFNYDLPWNPNRLEQRMGRLHRIGQRRNVFYNNFVVADEANIDGYIMDKLLCKIDAIRTTLGDRVYNILGSIIDRQDMERYYAKLRSSPYSVWESKITELKDVIEKRMRDVLEKSDQLLEKHRLDHTALESMAESRKSAVTGGEVRRLVGVLVESNDGSMEEIRPGRFRVMLPRKYAARSERGIIDGAFDPKVAEERGMPLLSMGNRYIDDMLADAAARTVAVLSHPVRSGLLCVYRMGVYDGKKREKHAMILALFHNDDGRIDEVEPRSIWDYRGADRTEVQFVESDIIRVGKEANSRAKAYLDEQRGRMDRIKKRTKDAARSHAAAKMDAANKKQSEYEGRRAEGPHMEHLIDRQKTEQARIQQDMKRRLDQIETEFTPGLGIQLLGVAKVVSVGNVQARRTVELAGMDAVKRYERDRATSIEEVHSIRDVSDTDAGYDIESFDRHIEVKSFSRTGPLEITSHEWETCRRLGDDYWLYAVEDALTSPRITPYQNPCALFAGMVREEKVVRYVIDGWNR